VRITRSGEEKSRLNSSVFPSGRVSKSSGVMLGNLLGNLSKPPFPGADHRRLGALGRTLHRSGSMTPPTQISRY
jgi:hypothetical protein